MAAKISRYRIIGHESKQQENQVNKILELVAVYFILEPDFEKVTSPDFVAEHSVNWTSVTIH